MPPAQALAGVPLMGLGQGVAAGAGVVPPVSTGGVVPAAPGVPPAVMPPAIGPPAVVLPAVGPGNAATSPSMTYVGEGIAPVPKKVADRILRWDFVEMGELLPEFGLSASNEQSSTSLTRRSRKVTEISTWTMCFATFVGILGPANPAAVPELMAYLRTITRASQDFEGLAWERYDAAYRRQAAASKNRSWSRVDTSLYALCFSGGKASRGERCELCLAATHTTKQCALQGNPDPELGSRIKAVESILVAMAQRPGQRGMPTTNVPDNTCRLWNRGNCTFPRCRFRHTCSTCGGDHPMVHCQRFAGGRTPAPGGRSLPNKKY